MYSFLSEFLGIDVMSVNHKLIVFGITGDCPALSLITNFINHNGYFCCWLCLIEGEHINNKRQYRYDTIKLRTKQEYSKLSAKAERTQSNIYGHLGESILSNVLDVKFPDAIVLDYLHVSLLGHAKLIILSIYQQLKPTQRAQLNSQINNQAFPRKLILFIHFWFIFLSWILLFVFRFLSQKATTN
jgi:hypothetical protein